MWNESKKLSRVFGLCSMNIPIILSHYFNSTGALNRAMIWLKFLFGNDLLMFFFYIYKTLCSSFSLNIFPYEKWLPHWWFLIKVLLIYSLDAKKFTVMLTVSILKKSFSSLPLTDFFSQKLRLQKENYDKLYVTLFSVYLQKL